MISSYIFKSPIGLLKICEENSYIINLCLLSDNSNHNIHEYSVRHSDLLYEAYVQLNEYFSGNRKDFELPINYIGTTFQKQVWHELQNIPFGTTRSYEDVADSIGNPKAFQAVGQANSKNPIMIIVPCHRVIRKNGNISGYTYGKKVKEYLLDLEKRNV